MNIQPVPSPELRRARMQLLEGGDFIPGSIDERLARSWRRSLAAGLAPRGRLGPVEILSGGELQRSLARSHELISHSRPIMEYLFEQVRHSHSMVILADSHGVLMHTLGEGDFLGKAERVALRSGASWHEQQRGTNAIGTALAECAGLEIHGQEHFLERNGFLTCAAAPIVSATGELLGALDISGDQRARHPHTLGLVNTAARMIENKLMATACSRSIRLHLHHHPEGIGSVAEGILGLREDGCIVAANRAALQIMGLGVGDLGTACLQQHFDCRLADLFGQGTEPAGKPRMLRRRDGGTMYAVAYAPTGRTVRVRSEKTASLPTSSLDRLDTGDLRWRSAADKARRALGKAIPLLLIGESGVGKELFARAVHESSLQAKGPFVAINCAALPETLIEAELFGYAPGAFSGARKEGSPGRLREADGGTLFLDEIGDMPLAMQTRLLRVLQERQVMPLGGGRAVPVSFNLIAATHCNLREAVENGRFRADLYYRINGLTLNLPALRERSDFTALVDKLLEELSPESHLRVETGLLASLAAYRWPGNLRQLANALRTAVAMLAAEETCVDWGHMPDDIVDELLHPRPPASEPVSGSLEALSRRAIDQALRDCHGNVSEAARRLGISRQTLYRRIAAGH